MKPLGRTHVKFPSKRDQAPNKQYQNWWEYEIDTANKKGDRRKIKMKLRKQNL